MEKILSQESIDKLWGSITKAPGSIRLPFNNLVDEFALVCIKSEYKIDVHDCALVMPTGRSQEESKDIENCLIIHERMSHLTPGQATDERLWVTLCFHEFRDYCLARWSPIDKKDLAKSLQAHWFSRGARGRIRDNCIARLWWMAYFSSKISTWPIEEVLKKLMFNSDFRSSLIERPSSANSENVATSILMLSEDAESSGIPYKRDCFRKFMQMVDLRGKRTKLASLSIDELFKLLKDDYLKSYSSE